MIPKNRLACWNIVRSGSKYVNIDQTVILNCFAADKEARLGTDKDVYCVYDYEAQNPDELTLLTNQKITILRREEGGWWWAACGDNQGYVAKNLLAVSCSTPV